MQSGAATAGDAGGIAAPAKAMPGWRAGGRGAGPQGPPRGGFGGVSPPMLRY